ncbi:hypothetical protein DFQ12_0819 [Sphingobacterium detergens]|uniref:Uncharacterized protein n=1 Tax=Sphingobacterium detergens TaxID=1145106 RepID=A0A420BGY7_SPHD1|nr:hypothetical protein DFQ12_0819 [Sphingobacterium detergens]
MSVVKTDLFPKNGPTATNNKAHQANCNFREHLSIKSLNLFKNLPMKNKWYNQNDVYIAKKHSPITIIGLLIFAVKKNNQV